MDFQYSDMVDPSTYDAQGLCDGIPLRKHRDKTQERTGAMRAQHDWTRLIGPLGQFNGGSGTPYSFYEVALPECRPERMEIISYAGEFLFLYDDWLEKRDQDKSTERDQQILDVFGDGPLSPDRSQGSSGSGRTTPLNGHKQIQLQILSEMSAIDAERASTTMKTWATWVKLSTGRKRSQPFASLEEYIPYRIMDVSDILWFGFATFSMALTIPEKEMELCQQLVRPAFAAIGLSNDLFSWERERDSARENGRPYVINAVWVLMGELSVSEDEAKSVCRKKIKECVAEYISIVQKTKVDSNISPDLRFYVEATQYCVSGNMVWSTYCPRYHLDSADDPATLSMGDAIAPTNQKTH